MATNQPRGPKVKVKIPTTLVITPRSAEARAIERLKHYTPDDIDLQKNLKPDAYRSSLLRVGTETVAQDLWIGFGITFLKYDSTPLPGPFRRFKMLSPSIQPRIAGQGRQIHHQFHIGRSLTT